MSTLTPPRPRFRKPLMLTVLLALFAFSAVHTPAQPSDPSGGFALFNPGGAVSLRAAQPVRAELLADTAAVEPGRPFRLGVRLTMDPGWHTYWLTAGDAGQATRITWDLPAGFSAGPLQWPLPERFETPGAYKLISYGYENQVLLFTTIHPPASLPAASPLQFSAKVHWIACQESCIPGDADPTLTLPIGKAAPSPAATEFDRAAAEIPTPLATPDTDRLSVTFNPHTPKPEPNKEQRLEVLVRPKSPWRLDSPSQSQPQTQSDNPQSAIRNPQSPALFPLASGNWQTSHPSLLASAPGEARFAWPVTYNPDLQSTSSQLQAVLRLPLVNASTGQRQLARLIIPVQSPSQSPSQSALESQSQSRSQSQSGSPIPHSAFRIPHSDAPVFSFLKNAPAARLSLWQVLLYAFIGGLILNVMPCVLPVLSLKVLGFVRQAGQDRRRTFRLGLAYALGVLLSFAALAAAVIILQRAGAQVGQGFQLQEPRFVVIMAGVVFALGLSLLGVYTIELPGAAVNRLDQVSRREGYPGAFLSGVLSTALATPCSAPFLGPALGFAFTQPPAVVLLIFLLVGLGLAAPYVLLSANPALLRFVPRPGKWMLIFEQLMGFVLLGFVVWLLWVLGRQVDVTGVVWTLAFLLAVAVACWLVGLVSQSNASRPLWGLTLLVALTLTGMAFFIFPERYLRVVTHGARLETASVVPATSDAVAWEPFSIPRVEQLAREGRTVFVDFTADWCLTCKYNERAFDSEKVRQLFRQHHVVALKADWTSRDETIGRVLRQFGSSGVPLYVIFPAGRPDRPRVLPTLISPELIERELNQAAASNPS